MTIERHPLITAAEHFRRDESRRKRKRLPAEVGHALERSLETIRHQDGTPLDFAARGDLAVSIFGYDDTLPAAAATVIADILWSVKLHGHDAADVMREAWENYYEDVQRAKSA